MKKNDFKKMIAALLVMTMTMGIVACGGADENVGSSSASNTESTVAGDTAEVSEETEDGITWPLAEEVTFTVAVKTDDDADAYLEKCVYWQELYERTNVKIEIVTLPTDGTVGVLNGMFASGTDIDAIMGGITMSESELTEMAANGYLMSLNEFIDDASIMTNFNERVLAESPATKGFITTSDGNIYSLPKYTAIEGNYLESPIWINKTWVEQLGMSVEDIKTIEDLEEVLTAFAENDMNGNGDTTDEIPYIICDGHSMAHMEAILGLWGLATKNTASDYYVYVKDGVVNFAPTSEAYKEALITLNRWYENGLIWSEAFTANTEDFSAKMNEELPVVGMYTNKTAIETNEDYEYVQLTPVEVDGYEPLWYRHPGRLGGKGQFSVTATCENADILMKWVDEAFYSFEGTIRSYYGEEEDGRWQTAADGKVELITLSAEETAELKETVPTLVNAIGDLNLPVAYTADDYENRLALSSVQAQYQENYEIYKDYMTDEYWPRPYYAAEDSARLGEFYTDIINTVNTKKAAWVTGTADIEAEWDSYVESLNSMGLDEMIEILQKTYNVFLEGME